MRSEVAFSDDEVFAACPMSFEYEGFDLQDLVGSHAYPDGVAFLRQVVSLLSGGLVIVFVSLFFGPVARVALCFPVLVS